MLKYYTIILSGWNLMFIFYFHYVPLTHHSSQYALEYWNYVSILFFFGDCEVMHSKYWICIYNRTLCSFIQGPNYFWWTPCTCTMWTHKYIHCSILNSFIFFLFTQMKDMMLFKTNQSITFNYCFKKCLSVIFFSSFYSFINMGI